MNVARLEWRPVVGLSGKLEVSNDGQIRSVYQQRLSPGRTRKLYTRKDGYQSISYKVSGMQSNLYVHVAVAKAFLPQIEGKYHVNHKDGNPSNNRVENLEWCTPGENIEHSRTHGKANRYQNRGENHGMHKLTITDVQLIRNHKGKFTGTFVAMLFKVSPQTIYDIWNGKRWKHVA